MNNARNTLILHRLTLVVLLLALIVLPVRAMAQTETPPVLSSRDLVTAELLAGPDFMVDDAVPTDGFYAIFTVRGPYGSVQARGAAMLRVRVLEMQALARLEEVSRRQAIVSGATDKAHETVQGAKQTVWDPAGTVERVPENVGRLFSRLGSRIGKRVEQATGSGDSSAPAGQPQGIARERRSLAQQLGVDPYTDNPLLSAKLDQVARWKFEGGLALDIATSGASAWAGIAARSAQLVWAKAPEDVRAVNEKRLASLASAASAEEIRTFLDNPAFTPTTQTLLVDQLESLSVPQGRESLVRLAGEMENRDHVRFLIAATGLLGTYNSSVAPLVSVQSRGQLAAGLTATGSLIVAAPVDCLAWTDRLTEFGDRSDFHAARREIVLTGIATSRTRHELSARGWIIREHFSDVIGGPGIPQKAQ